SRDLASRSGLGGPSSQGVPLAQFQYRAVDPEGKVVEGTIEAAEAPAVIARLQDRGLIPLKVGESRDGGGKAAAGPRAWLATMPAIGKNRVKGRDLRALPQDLSAWLSAGWPRDRGLATLPGLADN